MVKKIALLLFLFTFSVNIYGGNLRGLVDLTTGSAFNILSSANSGLTITGNITVVSGNLKITNGSDGAMRLDSAASPTGDPEAYFNSAGNSYFNGGSLGIGTATPNTTFQLNGTYSDTPSAIQALAANNIITANISSIFIVGDGAPVTSNLTNQISTGNHNQVLELVGTDDTNTFTLNATGNVYLNGGVSFTFDKGANMTLKYYENMDWRERTRSDARQ